MRNSSVDFSLEGEKVELSKYTTQSCKGKKTLETLTKDELL